MTPSQRATPRSTCSSSVLAEPGDRRLVVVHDLVEDRVQDHAGTVAELLGVGLQLLADHVQVNVLRQLRCQALPGLAVIGRLPQVRLHVVETVGVHNVRVELVGGVVFELTVDVVAEA